jgi:aminopeptidase-like protein
MESIDTAEKGKELYELIRRLYPFCRSITGNGVRESLKILRELIPLQVHEVPTGTKVFDWIVPKEWNINDAFVKNSKGEKVIDFRESNLHVLNYSIAVNRKVSLEELRNHLFTLPETPDWIPYRTSYYSENWGFCVSYNTYKDLTDDMYEVVIDSTLKDGHLTYGEFLVEGCEKESEVLISTHICHPSLCNDNLSGIAVAAFLAHHFAHLSLRYSYRFLFIPGSIGSITWLSMNEENVDKIKHGLVATCLGDSGYFTYKRTRRGDAEIDNIVAYVLENSEKDYRVVDFTPYGYDERQYCSPGFDLPVGCLMRTTHGEYPQYHTSADDLSFVSPENLTESFLMYLEVIGVLEGNGKYLNMNPKCEPQLGRRGLYQNIGGAEQGKKLQLAMLWVLNMSDGNHSLLDIARRSRLQFRLICEAARHLKVAELLKETI